MYIIPERYVVYMYSPYRSVGSIDMDKTGFSMVMMFIDDAGRLRHLQQIIKSSYKLHVHVQHVQ